MLIYKIIAIGITGALLSLILRQYKPEFVMTVPILTITAIFIICVPQLKLVLDAFRDISGRAGIELSHVKLIIKIIGISYVCQFASDICNDAGERAIASKIELGGRIAIITTSLPVIYSLLELVAEIISF